MTDSPLRLGAILILLTTTVYTDLRDGKIYNWLTIPAVFVGLFLSWLGGWSSFRDSLWGAMMGAGIFAVPYLISGLSRGRPVVGGGDVKLAAAIGALTGVTVCLWSLYHAIWMGLVIGVTMVIMRGWKNSKLRRRGGGLAEESPLPSIWLLRIPFGTVMCVGVLLALLRQ